MKIIQYCQHVLGIGHLYRSLEISRALSDHEVVLVSGGPPVDTELPSHVREYRLPDLQMDQNFKGLFSTEKELSVEQIKDTRRKRLLEIFETEQPDVFLVELYPFGRKAFRFELDPVLEALLEKRLKTCCVISSVRDILVEKGDHGKHEARVVKILNRYFDGVLVHGDPGLVKLAETFVPFDAIEIPVVYTGYIAPKPLPDARTKIRHELGIDDDTILITASAGGGNVGAPLLDSMIQALGRLNKANLRLEVFTGPFLNQKEYQRLKNTTFANIRMQRFTGDFLSYLAASDLSVSMGGYNTTMNILATGVPALIWPFPQNREQRLRAERLAAMDLLTVLGDEDLSPDRLAAIIENQLRQPDRSDVRIDLEGAANTAKILGDWPPKTGDR